MRQDCRTEALDSPVKSHITIAKEVIQCEKHDLQHSRHLSRGQSLPQILVYEHLIFHRVLTLNSLDRVVFTARGNMWTLAEFWEEYFWRTMGESLSLS